MTSGHQTASVATPSGLSVSDLVDDRALDSAAADLLSHEPMAVQVARLIGLAQPPFALALFGPWGSGKSSFFELLRRAMEDPKSASRIVRYDAWAFAGESLQRHFISSVASELGFKDDGPNDQFHSGLYESRRSVKFDPEALARSFPTRYAIQVALLVGAFIAAFSFLIALFGRQDVIAALLIAVGPIVSGGLVVAAVTGILQSILAQGKVNVEQAPPSPELFRKTFTELVEKALEGKPDRLVVFIDEIDRCHPRDVIAILTGIRTFFDAPRCVFVVAADREVVEHALTEELPKLPSRPEEPYYSTAGAFLDKIFQHQIVLPPLRQQRLGHLALSLVKKRTDGIWHELQDGRAPTISHVMLALVPSHVVSPRRVKVLLNNFATAARMAEARGLNWRGRANELAKLTVLRTEFPGVVADLESEPRLLKALVERPPNPTGRLGELLKRYPIDPATAPAGDSPETSLVALRHRRQIAGALLGELYRYLSRTREVPDPGRDLIYLESAAAPVNLVDTELGDFIERTVTDDPDAIGHRLQSIPEDERLKAIQLISGMATSDLIADERTSALSALVSVVDQADQLPDEVEAAVLDAIAVYRREVMETPTRLLPRLLKVGLRFSPRPPWVSTILSDAHLFETPENTRLVAKMSPALGTQVQEPLWSAIARHLVSDFVVLLEPIQELPDAEAREMLASSPVTESLMAHLANQEASSPDLATKDGSALINAARGRTPRSQGVEIAVLWALVETGLESAVSLVTKEQAATSSLGTHSDRLEFVLAGLLASNPAGWPEWAESLPEAGALPVHDPTSYDTRDLIQGMTELIGRLDEEGAAIAFTGIVQRLVRMAAAAEPDQIEARVLPAATAILAGGSADDGAHESLVSGLLGLRELPEARTAIEKAIVDDIVRRLSAKPTNAALLLPTKLGSSLSVANLDRIAVATKAVAIGPAVTARVKLIALVWLVSRIRAKGGSASVEVPFDEVQTYVQAGDQWFAEAWFKSRPPIDEAKRMLFETDDSYLRPAVASIQVWADRQTSAVRTATLLEWIGESSNRSFWARALATLTLDERELVTEVGHRIAAAPLAEDRLSLARNLQVLRPVDPLAQRVVADIIVERLDNKTKRDARIAQILFPALGSQHRSARRISGGIAMAVRSDRLKLDESDRNALRAAGLTPPRRWFR